MNQEVNAKPLTDPPSSQNDNRKLFFTTATLSKFMRTTYGPYASSETQRRLTACIRKADLEMVEIWKRVLAQLHDFEATDGT
jgi:hypothetical protein